MTKMMNFGNMMMKMNFEIMRMIVKNMIQKVKVNLKKYSIYSNSEYDYYKSIYDEVMSSDEILGD